MDRTRVAKTFDKLRAGELPGPTAAITFAGDAFGIPCSGCGEVIDRHEQVSLAPLRFSVFIAVSALYRGLA